MSHMTHFGDEILPGNWFHCY